MEQTGHGVPLIVSQYGIQAFDIIDNYINVTIPFNKVTVHDSEDLTQNLNKAQAVLLNYLRENPAYTIKDLVRLSSFSDSYVREIIRNLKDNGYIVRVGARKNGYWRIVK